jgi:hypothetical protein
MVTTGVRERMVKPATKLVAGFFCSFSFEEGKIMKISHRVFISWMLLFFAFSVVLIQSIAMGPPSPDIAILSSAPSDSHFSQFVSAVFR